MTSSSRPTPSALARTTPAKEPVALYVHVPFCMTRCAYCDFYSTTAEALIDPWVEAVLREAEQASDESLASADTLYLGGGTPSRLSPTQLERLIQGLTARVSLVPGAEVTVEANPDDVTADRVAGWMEQGVTRVSLGVQSLDDRELRLLGRRHDADAARRAISTLRRAGFTNIGVDLIYGLPGQETKQWRDTLDDALLLEPTHISCYELSLSPSAPLARRLTAERRSLPDDETRRRLLMLAHERLERAGFEHYEVSNWARAGFRSRHNQRYWNHRPYRGLGPAAHSFDGHRRRWWNVASLTDYIERLATPGGDPTDGWEQLEDDQLILETLMLGFRWADGFPRDVVSSLPTGSAVLKTLEEEGVVLLDETRARPTLAGMLLADALPLRFFGPEAVGTSPRI